MYGSHPGYGSHSGHGSAPGHPPSPARQSGDVFARAAQGEAAPAGWARARRPRRSGGLGGEMVTVLMVGLTVAGGLLFAGGLFLGVSLNLNQAQEAGLEAEPTDVYQGEPQPQISQITPTRQAAPVLTPPVSQAPVVRSQTYQVPAPRQTAEPSIDSPVTVAQVTAPRPSLHRAGPEPKSRLAVKPTPKQAPKRKTAQNPTPKTVEPPKASELSLPDILIPSALAAPPTREQSQSAVLPQDTRVNPMPLPQAPADPSALALVSPKPGTFNFDLPYQGQRLPSKPVTQAQLSPQPAPKPAPQDVTLSSIQTPYYLQAGAFGDPSNAKRRAVFLHKKDLSVAVIKKTRNGKPLYLIRVFGYQTKGAAETGRAQLKALGVDSFVGAS